MPVEVEVVEASREKPLLMAGSRIDLINIADILMKMDRAGTNAISVIPLLQHEQ
jgi:hypothetical protein